MSDSLQLCTFELGELYLGVPLDEVQEVLRHQDVTRVPLAPGTVRGLINLRGQIVAAIDLRRMLGLDVLQDGREPMNVVIRGVGRGISLVVDEIGDVLELPREAFEEPPESLEGVLKELVVSVYKLEDRLLVVLDTGKTSELCSTGTTAEGDG